MPYCPQCLTEYVEGTTECEDCHANLVTGSPPERLAEEDELDKSHAGSGHAIGRALQSFFGAGNSAEDEDVKLTCVKTFTGSLAAMDADVARSLLHSQGIPSILQGETSAGVLPVLEIPLLVAETDAKRAEAILHEYFDRPDLRIVK
jgi:putative signal transducing protein